MPAELSAYEKRRLKNIEENRRVLTELGLFKAFVAPPRKKVIKKAVKRKRPAPPPKPTDSDGVETASHDSGSDYGGGIRRSRRVKGQVPIEGSLAETTDSLPDEDYQPVKKLPRPKVYGAIPGVEVGTSWDMRIDCSADGIHRPTVAGIHGGEEGCYSLALSGGYEDDLDFGEYFTYTGEDCCDHAANMISINSKGGRDLKGTKVKPKNLRTAPQSKDQSLSRGNYALSQSAQNGRLVRVIRGYKLDSVYAPEEGYRYDGLYTVERYWFTTGLSGYGVYKFALKRCSDQAPPPWGDATGDSEKGDGNDSPCKDSKEENNNDGLTKVSKDGGNTKDSGKNTKEEDASSDSRFSEQIDPSQGQKEQPSKLASSQ